MSDVADVLKARTMRFALRVVRFSNSLPDTWEARYVRDQLFRSAASGAANYHASCRGRTRREFIAKLGIVVEEFDESAFWLQFLTLAGLSRSTEASELLGEARELVAISVASIKTAIANRHQE